MGMGSVCNAVGTSFGNYGQTFAWLFNDQQQRYEAISGRKFAMVAAIDNRDEEA
jgi:hypothetical protein